MIGEAAYVDLREPDLTWLDNGKREVVTEGRLEFARRPEDLVIRATYRVDGYGACVLESIEGRGVSFTAVFRAPTGELVARRLGKDFLLERMPD